MCYLRLSLLCDANCIFFLRCQARSVTNLQPTFSDASTTDDDVPSSDPDQPTEDIHDAATEAPAAEIDVPAWAPEGMMTQQEGEELPPSGEQDQFAGQESLPTTEEEQPAAADSTLPVDEAITDQILPDQATPEEEKGDRQETLEHYEEAANDFVSFNLKTFFILFSRSSFCTFLCLGPLSLHFFRYTCH